jgi:BlaI family transcriptional regulator, penicillinase repressor
MSSPQPSNGEKKAGNGAVDPRRRSLLDLAPLELDCMNTLWPIGEGTVREIRDQLAPRRPRAYTTIMTIMDRLARKGIVERRKSGRAYIYRPSLSIEDARTHALGQIVESFFGGSREIAAAYLRDGGLDRKAESLDVRPALALAASASASTGVARSASVAVNSVTSDSVADSVSNPAVAPDAANSPVVADLTPAPSTRTRNSSDDAPPIDATLL